MAAVLDHPYRLTVEEYEVLAARHPLVHERTELIDGVIYSVSPESVAHLRAVETVYQFLRAYGLQAFQAGSVQLDDGSLWAPDVWVVSELPADGYVPVASLLLVAEISVTTLRKDLGVKAAMYARNGVPEYWVVDVERGDIRRHTRPKGDRYLTLRLLRFPDGMAEFFEQAGL